jgi:hypothetical protein
MWKEPNVSTSKAMPETQTIAAASPCKRRPITRVAIFLPKHRRAVATIKTKRPAMNGFWREGMESAREPQIAVLPYQPTFVLGTRK